MMISAILLVLIVAEAKAREIKAAKGECWSYDLKWNEMISIDLKCNDSIVSIDLKWNDFYLFWNETILLILLIWNEMISIDVLAK